MTIPRTIHRRAREPMRVDFWNPEAAAVCDGCGFWVNRSSLVKRMAYRGGTVPVWDGFLVCGVCDDVPNPAPQFSRLTLSPDPVPVQNPRPEQQTNSGFGYLVTETGLYFNTMTDDETWGGEFLTTEQEDLYP